MDSSSEATDDEQLDVETLSDARALLLQGAGNKRGAVAAAVSSPSPKPPSKVRREEAGEESGATVTEQVEALEQAPLRDQRGGRMLSYTEENSAMPPKPMLKVAGLAVPVSSARAMCPVRCSVGLGIGLGF